MTKGRRRWVIAGAALVFLVAAITSVGTTESLKTSSFDQPDSESAAARAAIARASGTDPYFAITARVTGSEAQLAARSKRVEDVLRADQSATRVETVRGGAGSTYVVAGLAPVALDRQMDAARRVEDRLAGQPGVQLGGLATFYAQGADIAKQDLARIELFTLPILFLLMLWVFRGFVAALVPVLIAAFTITVCMATLKAITDVAEVSIYAINVATALGIGLAVDYSLLIVSRYREEIARRGAGAVALAATIKTAGRTVLFSSITVAGSLAILCLFPHAFLRSIGIAGAIVALLSMVAALVILPAVLAALGGRINALAPPSWRRRAESDQDANPDRGWGRLSRFVARRSKLVAPVAALVLLVLSLPLLGLHVISVTEKSNPPESSARQVQEAIAKEQPKLGGSSTFVAVSAPAGAGPQVGEFADRLDALPGSARVGAPVAAGDGLWKIDVASANDPSSTAAQGLVRDIRNLQAPFPVAVGGETAALIDLKSGLESRLPIALIALVLFTFFTLLLMTRSVLLPLKTLLMNALTLCATLGVIVFVFQEGRFDDLLGLTSQGGVEAVVLVLLIAFGFGLATDYAAMLMARVKEQHDAGAANFDAVVGGLERSGRIITAAAAVLCVALGSLVLARHALVREIGFGSALAVAIDATLVRLLLAPSLMRLMGRWNWWLPGVGAVSSVANAREGSS